MGLPMDFKKVVNDEPYLGRKYCDCGASALYLVRWTRGRRRLVSTSRGIYCADCGIDRIKRMDRRDERRREREQKAAKAAARAKILS